jgi:hypothetical protein
MERLFHRAGTLRDVVVRRGGTDQIAVEYHHVVAAAAVRTESLRLDLGSASAGRDVISIVVRDLQSGQSTARQREVVTR